jgi:hypothetical protein
MEICTTSTSRDRKRFARERQNRCRPEGYYEFRVYKSQFLVQPPPVVCDLACRRLLVDAALAALLELEVLDGIGDVDAVALDASFRHRPVEELAGGSNEGFPLVVFLVARLLANEGDRGADWTFAQHCTRRARHEGFGCCDHGIERI